MSRVTALHPERRDRVRVELDGRTWRTLPTRFGVVSVDLWRRRGARPGSARGSCAARSGERRALRRRPRRWRGGDRSVAGLDAKRSSGAASPRRARPRGARGEARLLPRRCALRAPPGAVTRRPRLRRRAASASSSNGRASRTTIEPRSQPSLGSTERAAAVLRTARGPPRRYPLAAPAKGFSADAIECSASVRRRVLTTPDAADGPPPLRRPCAATTSRRSAAR